MSEHWEFYPCQVDEETAFIFYDEGISGSVNDVTCESFVGFSATLKAPNQSGLPTNAEFPSLVALEDRISAFVDQHRGHYVGRITVGGLRLFQCYVALTDPVLSRFLADVAAETGYRLETRTEHDPARAGYWDALYPSEDDRQVISDLHVLEALEKQGDVHERPRQVDHWAYFPTEADRTAFSTWALAQGYQIVGLLEPEGESLTFGVRLSHMGTMRLDDITHHTITLNRAATKANGDYDGWETEAVRG